MKILELTNFSAGTCGVFARVFQESKELKKKGHEILILSSNAVKGTNELAEENELKEGIQIKRFLFKKLGGESFMSWANKGNVKDIVLNYKPDVIIAHSYRHLHTRVALKLAKQLNCKIFLVTHAPFSDNSRSFSQKLIVKLYDLIYGKELNKFTKVIAITRWEMPYLDKLGVNKDKIVYIPNGLSSEFFFQKSIKQKNKILFLGRISPIKNLEVLIKSMNLIKDKTISLEIVGPAEKEYKIRLESLISQLNLNNIITFSPAIYDLKKKISKIDEASIFVLPSKSEAMPQSLIEAMSRGRIVIASRTMGAQEIIKDNRTGLLFDIDSSEQLAKAIEFVLDQKNKLTINKIRENAEKQAKEYFWDKIIKILEKTILS